MKRAHAVYKYRDTKGTVFFIERQFEKWRYSYPISGAVWHESEWHDTRRACKLAIIERFGKIRPFNERRKK